MPTLDERSLTVSAFAKLAGISERKARRALARAAQGKPWNGYALEVRLTAGRGGRGGVQYRVLLASLPADLRARWEGSAASVQMQHINKLAPTSLRLARGAEGEDVWEWRLKVLRPAIDAMQRGQPTAPLLRAAAAAPEAPSIHTLAKWLRRFARKGIFGLAPQERADRGQQRTIISRDWDRHAQCLSRSTKMSIRHQLDRYIKSLYAHGERSARVRADLVATRLIELTRGAGLQLPPALERAICTPPRHFIELFRHYQLAAIKRGDAKRFADEFQPRVRRDRSHLEPMQIVAADVHPLDILYTRADGSTATPRAITWLDLATNRAFMSVVFLGPREGVRQEHVIRSFIDMVAAWGMPRQLYLDNGSEYNWTDFARDALRLASFGCPIERVEPFTRARPYNAQAKVIESFFAAFETLLSSVPGHIGGDRMRKKTQSVGRPAAPFPGSAAELEREILTQLDYYHVLPSAAEHLDGLSPRDAFARAIDRGWQRIDVDPQALEATFATDRMPLVNRGIISVDGIQYYADALLPFTGRVVHVRVPKVGDRRRLTVLNDNGRVFCVVTPETSWRFEDREGAREAGRRARTLARYVGELQRDVEPLDIAAERRKALALHPAMPSAPSAGVIRLSDQHEEIGAALRSLPPAEKSELPRHGTAQTRALAKLVPDPFVAKRTA